MIQTDNIAGQLINNRYKLIESIGEGGMGAVYRSFDRLTGQMVALKRVLTDPEQLAFDTQSRAGSDSMGLRMALAQEFKTLSSLRHPHIISVLDYGFDEQRQPFFTMTLMEEAEPLVQNGMGKNVIERVGLLIQTLQALAYLHRRGIIHRDLKPGNVLVSGSAVRVLDFGLSIVRESSTDEKTTDETAGTLAYISPEVLQGKSAREESDLYAVGIMAYELFTGKHPFNITNIGRLVHDVLMTRPDLSVMNVLKNVDLSTPEVTTRDDTTQSPNMLDSEKTFIGDPVDHDDSNTDIDDIQQTVLGVDVAPLPESEIQVDAEVTAPVNAVDMPIDDTGYEYMPMAHGAFDDLPPLAHIIGRLLEKDPDDRYEDAYEVIAKLSEAIQRPMPEESAAIRESFLQAAKFVGRRKELQKLEGALENIHNKTGSAWLISGENGTGKTRLLDELRTRALVMGFTVVRSHGVSGGGLPYQLWREPMRRLTLVTDLDDLDASILKDIVPDIDQLLDREVPPAPSVDAKDYHQRLLGTIISVFQRQTEPTLVLLEDLQWLKESLDILKVLNGMVGDLPILLVGTYRHEERPDLYEELPTMELLHLDRLSPESIAELSESMLGPSGKRSDVLDFLQRETEGNVFFLIEVVRALAEDAGGLGQIGSKTLPAHVVSGGIEIVIQRRLARVPEPMQRLLRLAAVDGREIDLRILEEVNAEIDLDDWLTTCSNSAVLEIQDENWLFAHDKLRQTMLESLDEGERPQLHREIAQAIDTVYPNAPEQAIRIAKHWREAGDVEQERIFIQRAGEYFLHISAFKEAITYLQRALDLLSDIALSDHDRRQLQAEILIKLGEANYHAGEYELANNALEACLSIYESLDETRQIARTLNLLGDVAWNAGEYPKSIELCERSLELFKSLNDRQGMASAVNRLGMVYYEQGDVAKAQPFFEQALTSAHAGNNKQIQVDALNNLGLVAYAQGNVEDARKRFEQILEMVRLLGDRRKIASVLSNLGSITGMLNQLEKASEYFAEADETFREIGNQRGVGLALHNLGRLAYLRKQYDEAMLFYEESLSISLSVGNRQLASETLISLGDVSHASGKLSQSVGFYEHALRIAYEIEAMPYVTSIISSLANVSDTPVVALSWLYVVLEHPAMRELAKGEGQEIQERLEATLTEDEIKQAQVKATSLTLETIVDDILNK